MVATGAIAATSGTGAPSRPVAPRGRRSLIWEQRGSGDDAGGGARTRMGLPPRDFKSRASTDFATPASLASTSPCARQGARKEKRERSSRALPFFYPPFESGKRDSNPRPQPWQGCALPTELFPHADKYTAESILVAGAENVLLPLKAALPAREPRTTRSTRANLRVTHRHRSCARIRSHRPPRPRSHRRAEHAGAIATPRRTLAQ
jgi:hypothetical protein